MIKGNIFQAASVIRDSKCTVVFTGAGISVESGIPPFRGPDGLWTKYNPIFLDINYFRNNPLESWQLIKEIFFDFIGAARPNAAHYSISDLEKTGYVHSIITQNIDNLHQEAGSTKVIEYHGTINNLKCMKCPRHFPSEDISLKKLPPMCPECRGLLRPDFVFFGEPIPEDAGQSAIKKAENADVMLLIGTTGEIMPASLIPYTAKDSGATIIEVNISESTYSSKITDIFLHGKATEILTALAREVTRDIRTS
jgi:NAD-dependent deacetylase